MTRHARVAMVGLAFAYSAILGLVYVNFVSPMYVYQGMWLQRLPPTLVAFQLFIATLPGFFLPCRMTKPSEFQVMLIYTIVHVPTVMIGYHICVADNWAGFSMFLILIACCLIALTQVSRMPPIKLPTVNLSSNALVISLLAFTVVVYASVIAFYGMPDVSTDIGEIYASRWDFKDRAAGVPSIVNYFYWWQGLVINPLIIIAGMLRRNRTLFLLGIVLEVVLFALTTLRTMLLAVFFCIFMVMYFRFKWRWKGIGFLFLLTVGMSVAAFMMAGEGGVSMATRIFVQRWLAIQGQLSGAYFDYFYVHDPAYLGDSFLRGLVNYPYGDWSPGEIIGDIYVSLGRRPISNATGNIWADAFGQFGFLGVIGAAAAAFILLWLMDSVLRRYGSAVAIMLFSTCALSLTEQGVQMAVLTGGMLPLFVIGLVAHRFFIDESHDSKAHSPLDVRT